MLKLRLNVLKQDNYAFFCPVSRVHLTLSSPVGFSNGVTPAILTALRAGTIIDVDNMVDLETGTIKEESVTENNDEITVVDVKDEEVQAEETTSNDEDDETPQPKPKRNSKKQSKEVEE